MLDSGVDSRVYAAVNEKIIIAGECHVDSRNTEKSAAVRGA